jgi:murein DD-endopeptidase MepM/ murein hydrolase activator NlpD
MTDFKPGGVYKPEDLNSAYKRWNKPNQVRYGKSNFYRIGVALLIFLFFLALKETSNPWGLEARENLKKVLTTDWNYQPVMERIVCFGLQLANLDWPMLSNPQPVLSPAGQSIAAVNLPVPVSGKVVRGFGMVTDPLDNMERFHSGIDIAAPIGSAVKAVQAGVIKRLGESPELGTYILIEHTEGFFTLYGGLSRAMVEEGQQVPAGRIIGEVGAVGDVPGGGLHFELRENNKLIDPLTKLMINPN